MYIKPFRTAFAVMSLVSLIAFLAYVFTTDIPDACAQTDVALTLKDHGGIFSMLTFLISAAVCAVLSFFKDDEPVIYND